MKEEIKVYYGNCESDEMEVRGRIKTWTIEECRKSGTIWGVTIMKDGTLLCGWFSLVINYLMGSSFWRLLFCFMCIWVFSCHYSLGWVATSDHCHQFYPMQFGLDPKVICQHFFVTFWQNFSTDFLFFEGIMVLFKSQGLQQCQHLLCVCVCVCWGGGGGKITNH